jgi:DNA polymerase I-like protein with 3'-5' exonuclease and polymerase domains
MSNVHEKNWTLPDEFPDLSAAKILSVDIETHDDDLKAKGPGVRRGAYIVGVALATDDGWSGYYPVAHDEGPNLNKRAVFRWLKRELGRKNQPKLGTNLLYDADFLAHVGVVMRGPWYDVQNAEPLIDENARGRYNLNALGLKYVNEGKDETLLKDECKRRKLRGDPQRHLWRFPARLVAPYALKDVDLPLHVFHEQRKILNSEDTWDLFLMETHLSPLLLQMRRRGVRLDEDRLERTIVEYEKELMVAKHRLKKLAGHDVEYWAAESLAKAFDKVGVRYGRTPKTNAPSFTKDFLKTVEHPIGSLVRQCREIDKFIGTFLKGQMRDQVIDGRVHPQFHQLKSDDHGTVTGRLSGSHPNPQFIPKRDDKYGPLCRSMFVPEEDHMWGRADYSQVEFRLFAHYARGSGAEKFREEYRRNPRIDYHAWCAEEAGIKRGPAKTTNFSIIYGVGIKALAKKLEMTGNDTRMFLERYHNMLPFAKHTLRLVSERAANRGWIRTVLKRRRRFHLWEPADWELAQKVPAVRDRETMMKLVQRKIAEAHEERKPTPRPGVRRAGAYKALNALIQGSAADLIKKAMTDAHAAGLFDVLPLHLTVHDELDNSVPRTRRGKEAWRELVHTMENAIPFKVPIIVDAELGKNWSEHG